MLTVGLKKDAIRATLDELSAKGISPFNYANTKTGCDCLPSCLSISYDVEITTTDWGDDIPDYDFDKPPNFHT